MAALHAQQHPSDAVTITGVQIDSFTERSLVEQIVAWSAEPGVHVAVGVNAHVCNLARKDPWLRDFLAQHTTYADGQSIVWASRLLGRSLPERLATTDLAVPVLWAAARDRIPVYFLGAEPGVAEHAANQLRAQIPGLQLRTHHGYFSERDTERITADIARHRTRILFVGLGNPVQERWVAAHAEKLPAAVLTCGGLFDWLSGANKRAPRWMIRAGLEWAWRVLLEPRRLAGRYLIGNTQFMAALARQRLTTGAP
ncbi:WecB/TagA/CpsF family glycosyltransferase [Leucobacter sp. HY1908]